MRGEPAYPLLHQQVLWMPSQTQGRAETDLSGRDHCCATNRRVKLFRLLRSIEKSSVGRRGSSARARPSSLGRLLFSLAALLPWSPTTRAEVGSSGIPPRRSRSGQQAMIARHCPPHQSEGDAQWWLSLPSIHAPCSRQTRLTFSRSSSTASRSLRHVLQRTLVL